MKTLLQQLPANRQHRKWMAVGVTVLLAGLFTLVAIRGFSDYGTALFVALPVFMGFASTVLYGYNQPLRLRNAIGIASLTVAVYCAGLVLFAVEGLICLLMAAPLGFLLAWLGAAVGHLLVARKPGSAGTSLVLLAAFIPTLSFIEKDPAPETRAVVSVVEIAASEKTVWANVIAFPQLPEPDEFLFRAGIAYPVNARIDGAGVGAVRHCNFNTGPFVEPIRVWEEGNCLQFDVVSQPQPMREVSPWDIHPPHLNGVFVSKRGQFKLTKLLNGKIRLEGTTWYQHNLRPAFYWNWWSDYIIHKIHHRVLAHIKQTAENKKA